MIAIKFRLFPVLITSLLFCFQAGAQDFEDIYPQPVESIEIPSASNGKFSVFIFLKKENDRANQLNTNLERRFLSLDFNNFNFYRIHMDPRQLCAPGKKYIMLDGWELDGYPEFEDYMILVNSTSIPFENLFYNRLKTREIEQLANYFRNRNGKTPFIEFTRLDYLFTLITVPKDTQQYVTYKDYRQDLDSIKDNLVQEIQTLDSSLKRASFSPARYLAFEWAPQGTNPQLSGSFSSGLSVLEDQKEVSGLLYVNIFPFRDHPNLGYLAGISLSRNTGSLRLTNDTLVEVVRKNALDAMGDKYNRIAYATNLTEKYELEYFSLWFGGSIKTSLSELKPGLRGYLSFSPGISVSGVSSANYHATEGKMTWGGSYPYDYQDTMFSGKFDFYSNEPVYKDKKQLKTNQQFVSGFLKADLNIAPFSGARHLFFHVSATGTFGSNLLTSTHGENLLSESKNDYNSLLYRGNRLNIRQFGLRLGLCLEL